MMTQFNDKLYLYSQLEYAEQMLMCADDLYSRTVWGNRCDALEAAIADMQEANK